MSLGELMLEITAKYQDAVSAIRKVDKASEDADKKWNTRFDDKVFEDKFTRMGATAVGELDKIKERGEESFSGLKTSIEDFLGVSLSSVGNFVGDAVANLHSLGQQGADAFATISAGAAQMAETTGGFIESVGEKLTNSITKPAMLAGSALAGMGLAGGIQGMAAMEGATKRFEGLGYAAGEVESIMGQVDEAVEGTGFWIKDMAGTAAMALTSGVKPGAELAAHLNTIKTAAASGDNTSLEEMGALMNNIRGTGKAYTGDLNQLQRRGIGVWGALSESMGKSQDELRKLASEGKITYQDLATAIDTSFANMAASMAGTTQELASWIPGMWGRLFQEFLGGGSYDGSAGIWGGMKPMLEDMYILLAGAQGKAAELGQAFGDVFETGYDGFKGWLKNQVKLNEETDGLQGRLWATGGALAMLAGPALSVFGKMLKSAGKFGGKIADVNKKVKDFRDKVAKLEDGASTFQKLSAGVLSTLAPVGSAVAIFGLLAIAIGGAAAGLGLIPEAGRSALSEFLTMLDRQIPQISERFSNYFKEELPQVVADGFKTMAELFETGSVIFDSLGELAGDLIRGLQEGFEMDEGNWATAAISMITSLSNAIISNIGALSNLGATFVLQIAQGIANNAGDIVSAIPTLIDQITEFISGGGLASILQAGLEIVLAIRDGIVENAGEIASSAWELVSALGSFIREEWNTVSQILGAYIVYKIIQGIIISGAAAGWAKAGLAIIGGLAKSLLASAWGLLTTVGAKVVAIFAGGVTMGPALLIAAGVALIGYLIYGLISGDWKLQAAGEGLVNMVKSGIEKGGELIQSAAEWLSNLFSSGVSDSEAPTEAGEATSTSYAGGIRSGSGAIEEAAGDINSSVLGALDFGEEPFLKGLGFGTSLSAGIEEGKPTVDLSSLTTGQGISLGIDEGTGDVYEKGSGMASQLAQGISDNYETPYLGGVETAGAVGQGITDGAPKIDTAGTGLMDNFQNQITQRASMMNSAGQLLIRHMSDGMKQAKGRITEATKVIVKEIDDILEGAMQPMNSQGKALANEIKDGFSSVSLSGAGRQIMAGLEAGLRAGYASVRSFMLYAIRDMQQLTARLNSIRSPSRVYMKFGHHIMDGLRVGLQNQYDKVRTELSDFYRELIDDSAGVSLEDLTLQTKLQSEYDKQQEEAEKREQEQKDRYLMQLQEENNYLLQKLLDKDIDIYMSDRKVGEVTAKYVKETLDRSDNRGSRRMGVRTI